MSNQSYSPTDYRYGFNGKEKDDEWKSNGNSYDYGFRMYDPRLGRFLSVDPLHKKYPYYSTYHFGGNSPIWSTDLDGLEPITYDGRLVGYSVTPGQGPTQIAADINNTETKKKYGFALLNKVTWETIVQQNKEVFPENNETGLKDRTDLNDPGFKELDLNPGDILKVKGGGISLDMQNVRAVKLAEEIEGKVSDLENAVNGLTSKVGVLQAEMHAIINDPNLKPVPGEDGFGLAVVKSVKVGIVEFKISEVMEEKRKVATTLKSKKKELKKVQKQIKANKKKGARRPVPSF